MYVAMLLHCTPDPGYSADMELDDPQLTLAGLAQDQWGMFTRRQAELVGVPSTTFERLIAGGSSIERVAYGVYRFIASPIPEHLELRAAWLQLAPETPAWERTAEQGLVSHRSAAALYGLGELPADRHEFTLPGRKQTRRPDVRLHRRPVTDIKWIELRGLPVTRPSQIAADLLSDHEDPEAVARITADAIRQVFDYPGTFVETLAPFSFQFGLRRGDGYALLRWLLDIAGDPNTARWLSLARESMSRDAHLSDVAGGS
jgi:hypothetical protein